MISDNFLQSMDRIGIPSTFVKYAIILMRYGNAGVCVRSRDQPNIEYRELEFLPTSIHCSFGIEGVASTSTRQNLLRDFVNILIDKPGTLH